MPDLQGWLEVLWIPVAILFGWNHKRMSDLETKIDSKADKSDLAEIKSDIKEILNAVISNKVEMARWQGRSEKK